MCLVRGPRGRAPGKSASQPSRGSAWPVWSPAAQRRGATNNGLHPILKFCFSNRQRQRFVLLVLTVRCCRSLPPRCYVTVLCFSNTVLQLCLAVSHVCLCERGHPKPTKWPPPSRTARTAAPFSKRPLVHQWFGWSPLCSLVHKYTCSQVYL